MKHLVPFSIMLFLFTSCGQSTTNGLKNRKLEGESSVIVDKHKSKDSVFLNYVVTFITNQIHIGELVISKGKSSSVRELARMIIKEQQLSLISVKELALLKNIEITFFQKSNGTIEYNKLNQISDEKFSSSYSQNLEIELLKGIEIYEKAAVESNDIDIKNWTNDALIVLRIQHSNVQKYQKSYSTTQL